MLSLLLVSNCGARVDGHSDAGKATAGASGEPAADGAAGGADAGSSAGAGGTDDSSAAGESNIADGGEASVFESCAPGCPDNAFCVEKHCHLKAVAIGAGYNSACAVLIDHSVRCWGAGHKPRDWAQDPIGAAPTEPQVSAIAVGLANSCNLLLDGAVECRGTIFYGTDPWAGPLGPVAIKGFGPTGERAQQVALGTRHACVLLADGTVRCWGNGLLLGDASMQDSTEPVVVQGLGIGSRVIQLAAGISHTCALLEDGSVRCWGETALGVAGLEYDYSATPVTVQGLPKADPVTAISSGRDHVCALLTRGSVYCWGVGSSGQLGTGVAQELALKAVRVLGFPILGNEVVGVFAGLARTCVALADGSARCWGKNEYGMLGDGSQDDSAQPVQVQGLPEGALGVRSLALGTSATCALMSDGSPRCWGSNGYNELGAPTPEKFSPVPIALSGW